MAFIAPTTRLADERVVESADQSQLVLSITEQVSVQDLASEYPKYGVLRRKWGKALRRQHPAAQAAADRIHGRMHRFLAHVASQEALVLVADGGCGDHAAVLVSDSQGLLKALVDAGVWPEQLIALLPDLRRQVERVAPGEWYKGYRVAPDGAESRFW